MSPGPTSSSLPGLVSPFNLEGWGLLDPLGHLQRGADGGAALGAWSVFAATRGAGAAQTFVKGSTCGPPVGPGPPNRAAGAAAQPRASGPPTSRSGHKGSSSQASGCLREPLNECANNGCRPGVCPSLHEVGWAVAATMHHCCWEGDHGLCLLGRAVEEASTPV